MRPRGSSSEQYYNGQRENPNPPKYEESSSPEKKQKSRNTHGVSAKTNALGLVSIILIIGMIATMFFAVSYSGKQQFMYFSPSAYLEGLSDDTYYAINEWYKVEFKYHLFRLSPYYQPYVVINGQVIYSDYKYIPAYDNYVFPFVIDGITYYSEAVGITVNSSSPFEHTYLHLTDARIGVSGMPDFQVVGDAWSRVKNDKDIIGALSTTGRFIVDSLRYELSIMFKILPWNYVEKGDRSWIDNEWEKAEIRNGL